MLPLATAHIAHLCAKAYKRGWKFKPSSLESLLIRRVSFEITSYCPKQTSSFFSHINAKYLIIVNIYLLFNATLQATKCNTENLECRVTSQSSVAWEGGYRSRIGLSTKMHNKENNTFLALLRLVFALKWTKK